ncbi:MAG TPA: SDR family oxidoreductase [Rhizomicrobium sp.]|nr:SDR family oxidoreductase [Rhizomicrobium sp.]
MTGAGSGIGRAAARALGAAGFSVVLAGRREAELVETAQGREDMLVVPTDVTQAAAVTKLFDEVKKRHGRLDVLFNNAGMNGRGVPFEELTYEDWAQVVGVNLTGAFLCAQAAFRLMKAQTPRGGRIINNGSISAHVPRPNSAPYAASKHGITGLTRSISLDGRRFDIACGQIDIGNAGTEMTTRMESGVPQADGSLRAEPRVDVRLVADAVVQMASLPLEANIQFMTIMATKMPFIGRG